MSIYIQEQYERLAVRTGVPCLSISFWRTVDHGDGKRGWGARAGIGDTIFGADLEAVIDEAVTEGINASSRRRQALRDGQSPSVKL